MGFSLKKKLQDFTGAVAHNIADNASRAYDQVNPFDNGRTFQQRTPTNNYSVGQQFGNYASRAGANIASNVGSAYNAVRNAPIPSVGPFVGGGLTIGQASDKVGSLSQAFGRSIPTFSDSSPFRFANNLIINDTKELYQDLGTGLKGQNPYTGNAKQQAGQALQDVLTLSNAIGGGAAKKGITEGVKAARAAKPVAGELIRRGAAQGAKLGGTFGAATGLSEGLKQDESARDITKRVVTGGAIGTAGGAVLGAAPGAAAAGARAIGRGAKTGTVRVINAAEDISGKSFTPEATARRTSPVQTELQRSSLAPILDQPVGELQNMGIERYVNEQVLRRKIAKGRGRSTPSEIKANLKAKFVDPFSRIEDPISKRFGFKSEQATRMRDAVDRTFSSSARAGQFLKDNGLSDVIQTTKKKDLNVLSEYLIAKHRNDIRADTGKTAGRDVARDDALIRYVEEQRPDLVQGATKTQEYLKTVRQHLVDTGIISDAERNYLEKKYPNYVPSDRIFNEDELIKPPKGTAQGGSVSLGQQSIVQKALEHDSQRVIQDPFESVVNLTNKTFEQSDRNHAARTFVEIGSQIEGNPFQLKEIKPTETIGNRPVVSFIDKGRKRSFVTTKEVAEAAKNLNKEQMNIAMTIASYPARILRLGATSANVAFATANVVKDIVSALVNSDHPLRSSVLDPTVAKKALSATLYHGGKNYQELVRQGALGTSFDIGRRADRTTVGKIRRQKGILAPVSKSPLRALEDFIGRSEELTRSFQYYGNKKAALKQGATDEYSRIYAADAARNNTVNFNRAGDWVRAVNTVIPYLNAGIQGSRVFVRNLKVKPVSTMSKVAVTTLFPMAVITANNLSDPDREAAYDAVPEYEKQNNFIIVAEHPKRDKDGGWNVEGNYHKIPMSQEVAGFANIVREGIVDLKKDKGFDFAGAAAKLVGSATSLKVDEPRQLVGQVLPQGLKPIIEGATNTNLFTGQQIVPDAQKNLNPEDQYNKNTSITARVVGDVLNQSPYKVDNAIRTGGAGVGQQATRLSDVILANTMGLDHSQIKGQSFLSAISDRFTDAHPKSPGTNYFINIQEAAKNNKLAGADYDQLNSIVSKTLDTDGKARPTNEQDALEKNRILAASPNIAKVIADAARTSAKQTGKPLDPLYDLDDKQQHTYYQLQATPYKSNDFNRIKDTNPWLQQLQDARAVYFDTVNNGKQGSVSSERVDPPNISEDTQAKLDQLNMMTGAEKSKFINENSDVQAAFDEFSRYGNEKRIAQGYDPFQDRPATPPAVQAALTEYNALPKGEANGKSKIRSAWIKAHPDLYAQMQDFYAKSALFDVVNESGKFKYAGETVDSDTLKDIQSAGRSIVKKEDGTYALDAAAASQANNQSYAKSYTRTGKSRRPRGRVKGKGGSIRIRTGGRIGGAGRVGSGKIKVAKTTPTRSNIKVAKVPTKLKRVRVS